MQDKTHRRSTGNVRYPILALVTAIGALVGCDGKKADTPAAGTAAPTASHPASAPGHVGGGTSNGPAASLRPAGGGPVSVTIVKAERRPLATGLDLTGTVSAQRMVDVRAQVGATIREVLVREGDTVRQGQTLFRLDDRNERAQLDRAQAQLLRDEAALADARRQLRRGEDLLAQNFISQGAVDGQRTAVQTQEAAVASSRAALHAAQVALSFMTIVAPQEGRLGAMAVHPGAYVSPGGAPLVTISQMNPVLVTFALPQRHLGDALAALKSRSSVVQVRAGDAPSADAGVASAPLVFVDSAVDAASGTVRVRAAIDNREARWWPGAYVKVRMSLQSVEGGAVVPVAAVVQGARGRTVFTVDDEGIAQSRPVEVLAISDGMASITGITPGDRVVLDGRQNLRNGSKVVDRSRDDSAGKKSAADKGTGGGRNESPR